MFSMFYTLMSKKAAVDKLTSITGMWRVHLAFLKKFYMFHVSNSTSTVTKIFFFITKLHLVHRFYFI